MLRLTFLLSLLASLALAQNVGIGVSSPLEKLHVAGRMRSDFLASPDTNVVLSDVNGTLINLSSGTSGQVLTSQGPGRSPVWNTPAGGSSGRIYFAALTSSVSNSVTGASAPITSLISKSFVPVNDTVMITISVAGRVTASAGMVASPLQKWGFRVFVNGTLMELFYPFVNANSLSGGVATGDLTGHMTFPALVNAGVPNLIAVDMGGLFTTSGSITLTINPAATSQHLTLSIADLPTN